MKQPRFFGLATALILCTSSTAEGQLCTGLNNFLNGPVQGTLALETNEFASAYTAGLTYALRQPLFVGINVRQINFNNVDQSAIDVGVDAGVRISLSPNRTVQLCPLLSYHRQSGPDASVGSETVETTGQSFSAGASIGTVLALGGNREITPFAGGAFSRAQIAETFRGQEVTATEDFFVLTLGAGIALTKSLIARPHVSIPYGLEEGVNSFGVTLSYNFGNVAEVSNRRR